jgi:protein-S-isoprenylcysteine O-methyltransferase Ste14
MTPDDASPTPATPSKGTGSLPPPISVPPIVHESRTEPYLSRQFALRVGELTILLVAIVGAVALGLGITDYFAAHRYILAYIIAYAGFRYADLMIRDELQEQPPREELSRRISSQLPLLLMFAAAPFERTFVYGGLAPRWAAALGLLIELLGMWLALGARIQLGFLSAGRTDRPLLVRTGFFRYIRHPTFAGVYLVLIGWPMIYGAPITLVVAAIIAWTSMRRQILEEESGLLSIFGEDYENYMRTTDALVPNIW